MHAARPAPVRLVGPALAIAAVGVLASLAGCRGGKEQETAAEPEPTAAKAAAASQAGVRTTPNPLKNAYFGEQHVHTAYSLDAYIGGARLTPDGAYRFAKGEEVDVGGQKLRLRRPLDWAAVTDHAEYIGEMYSTMTPGAPGHDSELLRQLRGLESAEEREKWFMQIVIGRRNVAKPQHPPFYAGVETEKAGWKDIVSAAERNYEPGRFTTIPAFEWSAGPKGANLHRNVFFRSTNVPDKVVSSFDIGREDGLWQWMDGLEKDGMQVLAIPHNSNASKGAMFAAVDPAGKPIDRAYAEMRSRFEPLVEMMQIKGNSEVHRAFWPNDEFADFENADSIQDFSERKFSRQNFVRDASHPGPRLAAVAGSEPISLWLRRRLGQPQRHAGQHGRGQFHRRRSRLRRMRPSTGGAQVRSAAGSRERTRTRGRSPACGPGRTRARKSGTR